ncbi:MAG: hypothetical protein ACTSQG_03330 [Promethearchaeota archaeon]
MKNNKVKCPFCSNKYTKRGMKIIEKQVEKMKNKKYRKDEKVCVVLMKIIEKQVEKMKNKKYRKDEKVCVVLKLM